MSEISSNCLIVVNLSAVNGSLRQSATLKAISNNLRLDLWSKVSLKKEGIDYRDTFSPVSKKDSLKIIMALVAHFDLELHQMDVKNAFLNGNLDEDIYMEQPEGFAKKVNEHLVCKLKKSIYGLKQASRQWYIKFNNTITSFGLKENTID